MDHDVLDPITLEAAIFIDAIVGKIRDGRAVARSPGGLPLRRDNDGRVTPAGAAGSGHDTSQPSGPSSVAYSGGSSPPTAVELG